MRRTAISIITAAALGAGAYALVGEVRSEPQQAAAESTTTLPPATTTTEAPTTTTAPPTTVAPTTTTTTTAPVDDGTLRPGEQGDEVLALQSRLVELGYWLGEPDSDYGHLTTQAVLAFQKAEGLARDGIAGPATLAALDVAVRPVPRSAGGDLLEIDLERQILLIVQDGQTAWVLNTSTGRSGWRTPPGDFRIERQIDGMRHAPLGDLYRPKYFVGGIAVHGSTSIPANAASHGCARVSNAAIDMIWSSGFAPIGTPVWVY